MLQKGLLIYFYACSLSNKSKLMSIYGDIVKYIFNLPYLIVKFL
ncbi:hypothetical protein FTA_0071 [Francisella tularensis subsp. holarctica FTNF002-00]|nr:hypothetical protein FTA_0071 [Francisella tularensis subsp. holarctica FTNF002-00]